MTRTTPPAIVPEAPVAARADCPPAARPLGSLARIVRSKNAGPTQLTLDLFFDDATGYARAAGSLALQADAVAGLYGLAAGQVLRFDLPSLHALKFTLPRAVLAGSPGDGDVYGAQQHAPLLGVLV